MKKINYLILLTTIITIFSLVTKLLSPTNTDFKISIETIDILSLTQHQIESIKNDFEFQDTKIDMATVKKITNEPTTFRIIKVKYFFHNYSEKINMIDLRIDYIFSNSMKEKVTSYNNGHSVANIILAHGDTFELYHYLLVDSSSFTDKELMKEFLQCSCVATYFTGPFCWTNGNEFKGFWKKSISYNMEDIY